MFSQLIDVTGGDLICHVLLYHSEAVIDSSPHVKVDEEFHVATFDTSFIACPLTSVLRARF